MEKHKYPVLSDASLDLDFATEMILILKEYNENLYKTVKAFNACDPEAPYILAHEAARLHPRFDALLSVLLEKVTIANNQIMEYEEQSLNKDIINDANSTELINDENHSDTAAVGENTNEEE